MEPPPDQTEPLEVALLLHPVFLGALGVLLLNDHVLKARLPVPALTGKLSDLAGLCLFPGLLFALSHRPLRRLGLPLEPLRWMDALSLATGLVFTAIQLCPSAAAGWAWAWAGLQHPLWLGWSTLTGHPLGPLEPVRHTPDPTDLLALPAVLWGPRFMRRATRARRRPRSPAPEARAGPRLGGPGRAGD